MGCHHGGYYTCSDHYNPGHLVNHKWENCFSVGHTLKSLNYFLLVNGFQLDRRSWGYRRPAGFKEYLPIQQIISEIVTTVRLLYVKG